MQTSPDMHEAPTLVGGPPDDGQAPGPDPNRYDGNRGTPVIEVTNLRKSKDEDWLQIDSAHGGRWAKRSAIDPLD